MSNSYLNIDFWNTTDKFSNNNTKINETTINKIFNIDEKKQILIKLKFDDIYEKAIETVFSSYDNSLYNCLDSILKTISDYKIGKKKINDAFSSIENAIKNCKLKEPLVPVTSNKILPPPVPSNEISKKKSNILTGFKNLGKNVLNMQLFGKKKSNNEILSKITTNVIDKILTGFEGRYQQISLQLQENSYKQEEIQNNISEIVGDKSVELNKEVEKIVDEQAKKDVTIRDKVSPAKSRLINLLSKILPKKKVDEITPALENQVVALMETKQEEQNLVNQLEEIKNELHKINIKFTLYSDTTRLYISKVNVTVNKEEGDIPQGTVLINENDMTQIDLLIKEKTTGMNDLENFKKLYENNENNENNQDKSVTKQLLGVVNSLTIDYDLFLSGKMELYIGFNKIIYTNTESTESVSSINKVNASSVIDSNMIIIGQSPEFYKNLETAYKNVKLPESTLPNTTDSNLITDEKQKEKLIVLGLDDTKKPSAEELKKAFKQKSLETHPDRNKNADAKEKFQEINNANSDLITAFNYGGKKKTKRRQKKTLRKKTNKRKTNKK